MAKLAFSSMAGGSFVGALFVGKLPFLCEDKRFGTGPLRGTAPMPLSGFDSLLAGRDRGDWLNGGEWLGGC